MSRNPLLSIVLAALFVLGGCQTSGGGESRDIALAGGIAGGSYETYARVLAEKLVGWKVKTKTTGGSSENLDMLVAGKVDLALAQSDVLASRVAEEPDAFGDLVVLGPVAKECVFIARKAGGAVDSFDDLGRDVDGREAVINIGTPESGMAETWNYISSLVPEQANAEVDQTDGSRALKKLAKGELDAVAWVTDPRNPNHVLLRQVRANPELAFMTVNDERLPLQIYQGTDVYMLDEVDIAGSEGEKLETVCMSALLVGPEGTSEALTAAVKAAGISID